MKITNQHVGAFLAFLAQVVISYSYYNLLPERAEGDYNIYVIDFVLGILYWGGVWVLNIIVVIAFIQSLLDGSISFTINIPTPFTAISSYFRKRREYIDSMEKIKMDMWSAKSEEELDLLIKKREALNL